MVRNHEVRGSIPLISTNKFNDLRGRPIKYLIGRYRFVTKMRIQIRNSVANRGVGSMCVACSYSNVGVAQNSG